MGQKFHQHCKRNYTWIKHEHYAAIQNLLSNWNSANTPAIWITYDWIIELFIRSMCLFMSKRIYNQLFATEHMQWPDVWAKQAYFEMYYLIRATIWCIQQWQHSSDLLQFANVSQQQHLVAFINANYKDLTIQNNLYLYAVWLFLVVPELITWWERKTMTRYQFSCMVFWHRIFFKIKRFKI